MFLLNVLFFYLNSNFMKNSNIFQIKINKLNKIRNFISPLENFETSESSETTENSESGNDYRFPINKVHNEINKINKLNKINDYFQKKFLLDILLDKNINNKIDLLKDKSIKTFNLKEGGLYTDFNTDFDTV